jgi:hypothetical protein
MRLREELWQRHLQFVIRIVFKIIKFWLDKTHPAKEIAGSYSFGLKSTGCDTSDCMNTSIEKSCHEN